MGSPIAALRGVAKDYGQGEIVVHALRDVNLVLERGCFAAVAGPSGSGKTTLLNIMSGLDRPSRGSVQIEGQEITQLGGRALSRLRLHRIGFVFQAYNLLPILTAVENAEYVLLLQGVGTKERRRRVMEVLEQVGIADLAARFPRELSGGQQQRVAIARAIAARPALVLADEPTANVDSKTAASLLELMARLNAEEGVSFLFSSHDPQVLQKSKRLIELRDGAITYDGPPKLAA